MSLLLDALKRAEQEKLARQAQEAASEESGTAQSEGESRPRKRSLELESVEAPAAAAPAPPAQPAPSAQPAVQAQTAAAKRDGARTVFAAKQPAASAPAPAGSRNKVVIGIVVVALLLAAAGGGYVWYEINGPKSGFARAPVSAPRPVTPAPVAAVAPAQPPAPAAAAPAAAAPAAAAPAAAAPEAAKPAAAAPAASTEPATSAPATKPGGSAVPARSRPAGRASDQVIASLVREKSAAKPAPLKLEKSIDPPRVRPDVAKGYEALRAGDLPAARASYEAAVAADAANLDAQLGLATAAARAGDRATATRHYRLVLNLDPRNPSALAGLAALTDFTRPDAVEQQLRANITQSPQNAGLHFTLGNVYASQGRWSEAQSAFFESYRLEPDNADTLYNLAVSMDQLGQAKLAADFYRRALDAASPRGAQFDKAQVQRRLAELKP